MSQSYLYIATIVNGVAVTFAYNLCAGLLRAVGDSLAALSLPDYQRHSQYSSRSLFLLPNSILEFNLLGLQPLLPGISGPSLSSLYSLRRSLFCSPHRKDFVWDKELYQDLQGLAMGLMHFHRFDRTTLSSNPLLQLGTTIISAQVAARRIMSFAVLPITAIASSITTFISQNFGAEQFHRIKKGVTIANLLSWFGLSGLPLLLFFTSPSITSFIFPARQILISLQMPVLSPDQLLLLSLFWRVSSS